MPLKPTCSICIYIVGQNKVFLHKMVIVSSLLLTPLDFFLIFAAWCVDVSKNVSNKCKIDWSSNQCIVCEISLERNIW